ncbi:MAG: hypothetical protein ABIR80_06690 [Opitutaceae bacterium]
MNEAKPDSPIPEADRAIATYGVPPPEATRQALRETLARERETFRTVSQEREQIQRRLYDRER